MDTIKKCKTVLLTGYGGYDKLKVVEQEKPKPKSEEVLVNVKASGINFAELMARQGLYRRYTLPTVLGFEASGEVVELGENVTDVKVGDRVICNSSSGLWSEYVAVPADRCFPMPEAMTYEEGAALPVNYVTAYHMLFDMAGLRKGKSVLVHMVAGGVGNAATQLCSTVPDVTIFGTCSAAKHETMKKAGVHHPIDYRTKNYAEEIRKISPGGVDIVLDPLNGADAVTGYNLLKPFGTIVHFGAANIVTGPQRSLLQIAKTWWNTQSYNTLRMIPSNKCVAGYHMGYLEQTPELVRNAMADIIELYKQGKVRPKIDSVWAFEDIGKAMARMHERKNVGKVIISPQAKAGSEDIRSW